MDSHDERKLIEVWRRETTSLNHEIDERFKSAQDEAYTIGLQRGRTEMLEDCLSMMEKYEGGKCGAWDALSELR